MSYLPRMSRTYKEPQEIQEDPEEKLSPGSIKPASALLNEKTYNPQMALKHYRYIPHAPPVLPGPSVLEEALENEMLEEAFKMRKASSKSESISKGSENLSESSSMEPIGSTIENTTTNQNYMEKIKRIHSRKSVKGSKSSGGRKRLPKTVKKDISSNITVNMHLIAPNRPLTTVGIESKSQTAKEDFVLKNSLKREKSALTVNDSLQCGKPTPTLQSEQDRRKNRQKDFKNESVQCAILESPSEAVAIPTLINSLLRTLGFLFQEIKKEEAISGSSRDKKFPMTQAQLILNELCSKKLSKDLGFDLNYSDFKRLEKISGEFQKYMKDIYGDKGEYIDKMEDLKRVFIESKSKEMELATLEENLQEQEDKQEEQIEVKEEDLEYPEITLQNKRLESEQLSAEVEFSSRELKKFQKVIAELDWDIKTYQEQVSSLKKLVASKSKTEVLGRKSSVHTFSSETLSKVSRNSETRRKKT